MPEICVLWCGVVFLATRIFLAVSRKPTEIFSLPLIPNPLLACHYTVERHNISPGAIRHGAL